MLLLHNHYGLSRLLNLGRARTLYADMPLKGGRPSLGVRFYLDAPDSAPVQVMGVLVSRKGLPILHEGGSGLDFALEDSPALQELLQSRTCQLNPFARQRRCSRLSCCRRQKTLASGA